MAHKASSYFIALILISNILLFSVSARTIAVNPNNDDKKFLFKSHGGVHIPGFGPVRFPPLGTIPNNPFTRGIGGGGAGAGTGPTGRSYVPGGDDTFVPNPGFEVPVPGGSGGRIPGSVHP
ncbi:putative cell wall protein [Arachis stenosperma]|uniref:putative cell wall protein n=1 Tax=Arachis stenosperma TaxID=217475 RepID=UPI0025ACEF6F|nr:putative cell wall protein [Arachis stenosperma]